MSKEQKPTKRTARRRYLKNGEDTRGARMAALAVVGCCLGEDGSRTWTVAVYAATPARTLGELLEVSPDELRLTDAVVVILCRTFPEVSGLLTANAFHMLADDEPTTLSDMLNGW